MLNTLTAISPVDGRYRKVTEKLADYFSEQALIRYRIRVEVEYFIALAELPLPQLAGIDPPALHALRSLYEEFSPSDAERVKEIESVTNHDVKAVEYILKEKMEALGLGRYKEFVHFGLTSQDINNTAIPLSLKEALSGIYYPLVEEVRDKLASLAEGRVDYYVRTTHTYEWDTAAGELILAEAGGSTRALPEERELRYNEEDLHNPWFHCRSKFCPF